MIQEKVNISGSLFSRMLQESLSRVLCEGVSQVCYHYTFLSALIGIIDGDMFKLYCNDTNPIRKGGSCSGGSDWYSLSVTRSKNDNSGFALTFRGEECEGGYVRITLDGSKFNERYKGISVDEFGDLNREDSVHVDDYRKSRCGSDGYLKYRGQLFYMQGEDRVLSRSSEIYDAHKYIDRIDIILLDRNEYEPVSDNGDIMGDMEYICKLSNGRFDYADKIHIYLNREEFNKQSNVCMTPVQFLKYMDGNGVIGEGIEYEPESDDEIILYRYGRMDNGERYFWASSTPYYMNGEEYEPDYKDFNIIVLGNRGSLPWLIDVYGMNENEVEKYLNIDSPEDAAMDGDEWKWDNMIKDGYCGFWWNDDQFNCTCYCIDKSVIKEVIPCTREEAISWYKKVMLHKRNDTR